MLPLSPAIKSPKNKLSGERSDWINVFVVSYNRYRVVAVSKGTVYWNFPIRALWKGDASDTPGLLSSIWSLINKE